MTLQMKFAEAQLVEFKLAEDGAAPMAFEGYGAVVGNTDAGGDRIAPGAFGPVLDRIKRGKFPMMLLQHGFAPRGTLPIGVWTDLVEDAKGLRVKGVLADVPDAREVHSLMTMAPRPAIDGLSIGFHAVESVAGKNGDPYRRLLTKVDVVEISIVSNPMNDRARTRSMRGEPTPRDLEAALWDAGLSKSEAKQVLARGLPSLHRDAAREAGDGHDDLAAILRDAAQRFTT